MSGLTVSEMKAAHKVLCELEYPPTKLKQGYAGRFLRVDVGARTMEIREVTDEMKRLWIGGKGLDLWLTFLEVTGETKWDSPENPIVFSPGPLGGTTSFPGSGKTLVTAISPLTGSMMDCNVGGYFGPYLKFCGFDALMVTGKASEDVILVIDGVRNKAFLETAPKESIDSHLLCEELTEMYSDSELDKRNIAVVASGQGAEHARMGVLNFSFYDWRRRAVRFKQAGRGGIGTVFRNKKLKALVVKNREIARPWRVSLSPAARQFNEALRGVGAPVDASAVRSIAAEFGDPRESVVAMMRKVQQTLGNVGRGAIDELSLATGVSRGFLYRVATFYRGFSLIPESPGTSLQKGGGLPHSDDKRHAFWSARMRDPVMEMTSMAMLQLFGLDDQAHVSPALARKFLAPGAYERLAKLFGVKLGTESATQEFWQERVLTRGEVYRALTGSTGSEKEWGPPLELLRLRAWAVEGTEKIDGCPVRFISAAISALSDSSCGNCTPCRDGLLVLANLLTEIETGRASSGVLALLKEVADTVIATSQCRYGPLAASLLSAAVDRFEDVFTQHVEALYCKFQQCPVSRGKEN